MTRIYLAAPSADLARVRSVAADLELRGHVLTCRWWDVIESDREGRSTDEGSAPAILSRAWSANCAGIDAAQIVVALAKPAGGLSGGVREELVRAATIGKVVRVVGDPGSSPFAGWLHCAGCVVATVGEALR